MNPLVTICITTYNRKELLPLTLKSILNQTYKNIEIIIVDDCSQDDTKKLVENELLKLDNRIQYIRHETNKGLAQARNTAIFNSKGEYFTFCDDDDEWLPNFVETFVKIAINYTENWCFCCGSLDLKGKKCEYNELDSTLKEKIKQGFTPPVASQFYHTSILKSIGGYNSLITTGVDHDLWINLSKGDIYIKFLEDCLSIPNANSSKHSRMTNNFEKRSRGIDNSLKLWKKDIVSTYSYRFYKHFKKEYYKNIMLGFCINSIREMDFKMIIKILSYYKNIYLTLDVVKKIIYLIFSKIKNERKSINSNTFDPFI